MIVSDNGKNIEDDKNSSSTWHSTAVNLISPPSPHALTMLIKKGCKDCFVVLSMGLALRVREKQNLMKNVAAELQSTSHVSYVPLVFSEVHTAIRCPV